MRSKAKSVFLSAHHFPSPALQYLGNLLPVQLPFTGRPSEMTSRHSGRGNRSQCKLWLRCTGNAFSQPQQAMHPFGGTPICPRCNRAVYAAEQVSKSNSCLSRCALTSFGRLWDQVERSARTCLLHLHIFTVYLNNYSCIIRQAQSYYCS